MNPLRELIGSECAERLMDCFQSIEAIARATEEELTRISGVGPAKVRQLRAAFALSLYQHQEERIPLKAPSNVYRWVAPHFAEATTERLGVILLDAKVVPLRFEMITVGTVSQTLVHPREVFYPAIRHQASSLIVVHNHPSGDPTPSQADLTQTKRLLEASRLLGIPLNDHLILGRGTFVSLRETTPIWSLK